MSALTPERLAEIRRLPSSIRVNEVFDFFDLLAEKEDFVTLAADQQIEIVALNADLDAALAEIERLREACDKMLIDFAREAGRRINAESSAGLTSVVCTDPKCTIKRKPGRPMHGPHDFRASEGGA